VLPYENKKKRQRKDVESDEQLEEEHLDLYYAWENKRQRIEPEP